VPGKIFQDNTYGKPPQGTSSSNKEPSNAKGEGPKRSREKTSEGGGSTLDNAAKIRGCRERPIARNRENALLRNSGLFSWVLRGKRKLRKHFERDAPYWGKKTGIRKRASPCFLGGGGVGEKKEGQEINRSDDRSGKA